MSAVSGTEQHPHVRLQGVRVAREGRGLVEDLSLEIPRGSFVAVVGPSGSGKTSLLATLAGLIPLSEGKVTYRCQQQCEHSPSDFQKRLGLVFQHLRLTPNETVLTNVLCGSLGVLPWWKTLFGFGACEREKARRLLDVLELGSLEMAKVRELSGGERQRAAIARALMQSPELILADEPVSHLDPRLSRAVLSYLKKETRESHRTVFCVLHDPRLVEEFADFVLAIEKDDPKSWRLQRSQNP